MFPVYNSNNTQGYITQTGYSHLALVRAPAFSGLEWSTGLLHGVDYWTGLLDWIIGLHAHMSAYLPTLSTLYNH